MKGIIVILLAVCASLQLKAQSLGQPQALKLDTTKLGAINLNNSLIRITEPIGLTSFSGTQPNFKSPVDFYSTMPVAKLQSADKKIVAPITMEGFNMPIKQIRINPDNTKIKVTP